MKSILLVLSLISGSFSCDLVPMKTQLERSFVIDTLDSQSDPCLIKENCFSGVGIRTVLRFDSHVFNAGRRDCTVGSTPRCPRGDDSDVDPIPPFNYDSCHKHWHLSGFSRYRLVNTITGEIAARGDKNGLCLMDVYCQREPRRKHTCQDQGISAGCYDIYDKGLDCQWVDITGVDTNVTYQFIWDINATEFIRETDYSNNSLAVYVNLNKIPRRSVRNSVAPNQCPRYNSNTRAFTPTVPSPAAQPVRPPTTTTGTGSGHTTQTGGNAAHGSGSTNYNSGTTNYNSGTSSYPSSTSGHAGSSPAYNSGTSAYHGGNTLVPRSPTSSWTRVQPRYQTRYYDDDYYGSRNSYYSRY